MTGSQGGLGLVTHEEACALIATLMNEWFALDPQAHLFTAKVVADELAGKQAAETLDDPVRQWYPHLAMEILTRAGAVEDAFPRVLAEIDALIDRLSSGLSKEDREMHWSEEAAEAWAEILRDTRTKLLRPTSKPRDLWIVGGVARQLDFDGITEGGDLAEALSSVTHHISQLPEMSAQVMRRHTKGSQEGRKGV